MQVVTDSVRITWLQIWLCLARTLLAIFWTLNMHVNTMQVTMGIGSSRSSEPFSMHSAIMYLFDYGTFQLILLVGIVFIDIFIAMSVHSADEDLCRWDMLILSNLFAVLTFPPYWFWQDKWYAHGKMCPIEMVRVLACAKGFDTLLLWVWSGWGEDI